MKQKHDFGPRERSVRSRTAPDEWNDLDKTTHTGLESRPIHDHQCNATNEKRNDLQNGTTSFCRLFFSYRAHKLKKLHKVGSSLEKVFPRVLGKCVLFLLRRTRTSSKVRCVLNRVHFARSERIAFLFFSRGRSLIIFFGRTIF